MTLYAFEISGSVKDMIETLGVPHTEVDLILVNGEPEDFSYRLQSGDRISVYPVFESIDISTLVRVRPQPLRESRFVADTHLGRLVHYLRTLQIWHESPELALWESTPEGAAMVKAERVRNTNTGSGIHP